jgi:urease accessory protein
MSTISITELMRVMQFGDSTLPVGGFAFSNGLESALQTEIVHNAETLKEFIQVACAQAAGVEGVALLHAHKAYLDQDFDALLKIDRELWLRRVGEEQQQMTVKMGKKFGELTEKFMEDEFMSKWVQAIRDEKTPGCFPIAHAITFASQGLPARDAFAVHQYGVAAMILSAALRIMRIDHYQTQSVMFEVNEQAQEDFERISDMSLDDMSGFAPIFDVLVTHHVNAYVRMFMN